MPNQYLKAGIVRSLVICFSVAAPHVAHAGMGAVLPKWSPPPCEGDACKGDDPRSGLPCQGLICTFSSAKSLQPPVTAAQAEAQRAAAASEATKPLEPMTAPKTSASAKTAASKKKRVKHTARAGSAKTGPDKASPAGPTQAATGGPGAASSSDSK